LIGEREFRGCVVELVRRAETRSPADIRRALERCARSERSKTARLQLRQMLENLRLAEELGAPICQDTGTLSFFVRLGERPDFDIVRSIGMAVAQAEEEIPLRVNGVDPLSRRPVRGGVWSVHLEPAREGLEVGLLVKGAGTENFSRLFMLSPSEPEEGICEAVLGVLAEAQGKICPPVVVGIGVGGDPSRTVLMSRLALMRRLGGRPGRLEALIARRANSLGIGPMGLGGRCTVLGVKVETAPTHTACLPVAVSFQCWPGRRGVAKLEDGRMEVVEP
jgi:fumarate hydratase subunit alpha